MKFIPCFLAAVCFAGPVSAQSPSPTATPAKPELPSGPLLRAPANFSQWEIDFAYPDEQPPKKGKPSRKAKPPLSTPAPAAATRLRKVVTTKTGRIVHEERIDTLQQVTDLWFDAGTQYTKSSKDSIWYRADRNAAPDSVYEPLPAVGYRNVEMISEENYVGTISHNNKNCLVFIPGGDKDLDLGKVNDAQKKLKAMDAVAYVDADSRQPVELRTHDELRTYQFGQPPTTAQTLPPDLASQIKKGEEGRARLNEPAPRPY